MERVGDMVVRGAERSTAQHEESEESAQRARKENR